MKSIIVVFCCLVVVLFASLASRAEFYRYVNENGVVSYTDNLDDVPADQRPEVRVYENGTSSTHFPSGMADPANTPTETEDRPEESGVSNPGDGTPLLDDAALERLKETKEALDLEYAEIQESAKALGEERAKLVNRPFERQQFEEKVVKLNRKIEDFERRRDAFEAEVARIQSSGAGDN
ncbi:MAG: DUF4124 domain-containing protein [Desulfobacterales bacterium]